MKQMIFGLLCSAAAMLVGCKSDTSEQNSWFQQPAPAEVSGTSVTLSCATTFGEGVLTPANAGIAYASVKGEGIGGFVEAPNPIISGNVITCRLMDLEPETTYLYHAFVVVGTERMQSPTMTFVTGQSGETPPPPVEGEPTFTVPIASDVSSSGASVSCRFAYEGQKTISKVYFLYNTTERVELTTEQGNKSAQLSGLSASTAYTFCLCVEIDGVSYSSGKSSFTTLSVTPPPTPGDAKYAGWAELPAEQSKPGDYYYAYHRRADAQSIRNYSICYSADMRCAVWVAYPLHKCYDGSAGRNDSWKKDPIILSSVQPNLTGGSYVSGYSRGHMIASSDRQVSKETNKQTFYVTNMAPQLQDRFNGGIWNVLEQKCWNNICSDTLFMVTGAHFANTNTTVKDQSGNRVVVPTHFYKVLIRSKSGNTKKPLWELSADQIQCVGFWFEHKNYSGATPAQYMTSVEAVEQQIGLKLFPNVPQAPKSTFNKNDWSF